MYNLLLAVDGSAPSQRAVGYLIGLVQRGVLHPEKVRVHLLNVQPQLPEAISYGMPAEALLEHYTQGWDAECHLALEVLAAAGLKCERHSRTGSPADQIVACASELSCEGILIGSHGAGLALASLLGSVASRVLKLSEVAVTLVK